MKRYNLLTDIPPVTVKIDNIEYAICYTCDIILKILSLVDSASNKTEAEYSRLAIEQLALFYPVIPENIIQARIELNNFVIGNPETSTEQNRSDDNISERPSYSYEHDADLIFSAFAQQYPTIDLKTLHWYHFQALFRGLTDDCLFMKVIHYRTVKITKNMSKSDKEFYKRMKRKFALPDNRTQEEKDKEFAMALSIL